jgi:hypothetical protein
LDWEATFEIIEGPNAGLTTEDGVCSPCSGTALDEDPEDLVDEANWTYQSNGVPGTDIIRACVTFFFALNGGEEFGEICTGDPGQDPDVIKHWIAVTGNLIISKECPNGDGDGDADFNILVTQLETSLAADSLDCDEVMVIEGLAPGTYTIRELITGPDANNFITGIACASEGVAPVTPGLQASVEIETGDMFCAVINVFDPDGPVDPSDPSGLPPTIIVPIDLDNLNTNTLDNNNTNDNNNENTNTQEQSNEQEQTNDNNQTTTVNSSPSVVIDFDE